MAAFKSVTKEQKTKRCLFLALLLQEPLLCLNGMLSLLLLKQLHATPFQIALLTMALPAVSIFSFYWSSILQAHPRWQRSNLILATSLAPFFYYFSSLSDKPTIFIFASCSFMLFWRGGNPALMEILKAKFSKEERGTLYSNLYKFGFLCEIILGPLLGLYMDWKPEWWKALFFCSGVLYGLSALVYSRLPGNWQKEVTIPKQTGSLLEQLIAPWKNSWSLLAKKREFRFFQIGFFLGGFGLMVSRPSVDIIVAGLSLSYIQLFLCRSVVKAMAILLSAKLWAEVLYKNRILYTSGLVLIGFCLFYLFLVSTWSFPEALFLAYFVYGLAQSGSHLVWNLSGTLVAEKESSTPYSSVNVLAVGLRGVIAPLLGAFFAKYIGLYPTLFIGGAITLVGAIYFQKRAAEERALELAR